ncbi:hypothetical protein HDV05_000597 [Chytridiales sp. JEL 0842]|nr:hypothetical protein HDV05_000597 [Chytridiales sp. JEL 0842]
MTKSLSEERVSQEQQYPQSEDGDLIGMYNDEEESLTDVKPSRQVSDALENGDRGSNVSVMDLEDDDEEEEEVKGENAVGTEDSVKPPTPVKDEDAAQEVKDVMPTRVVDNVSPVQPALPAPATPPTPSPAATRVATTAQPSASYPPPTFSLSRDAPHRRATTNPKWAWIDSIKHKIFPSRFTGAQTTLFASSSAFRRNATRNQRNTTDFSLPKIESVWSFDWPEEYTSSATSKADGGFASKVNFSYVTLEVEGSVGETGCEMFEGFGDLGLETTTRSFSSTSTVNVAQDLVTAPKSDSPKPSQPIKRGQVRSQYRKPLPERIQKQLIDVTDPAADPVIVLQNALKMRSPHVAYAALKECELRDEALKERAEGSNSNAPATSSGHASYLSRLSEFDLISLLTLLNSAKTKDLPPALLPRSTNGIKEFQRIISVMQTVNPTSTTPEVKAVFMRALFENSRASEAVKLAKELLESNPQNPQAMYEYVIGGLIDVQALQTAVNLLKKGLETGKLKISAALLTKVLKGLFTFGKADEAVRIFELAKENELKPGLQVLNQMALGFALQGKVSYVMKYIKEIKNAELNLNSKSHGAIIKAHAVRLQLGDAVLAYQQMRREGVPANAEHLADLIWAHGASGDVAGAVRNFHKLDTVEHFVPTDRMHANLIYAYSINGELTNAWRTLASAIKNRLTGVIKPNYLEPIAKLHVGQPPAILQSMMELSGVPENYRALVGATVAKSMLHMSYRSALELVKDVDHLENLEDILPETPLQKSFNALAVEVEPTLKTATAILESLVNPTSPLYPPKDSPSYKASMGVAQSALAFGYMLQRKPKEALELFRVVMKEGIDHDRRSAINLLLKGATFAKDKEAVKAAVEALRGMGLFLKSQEVECLLTVAGGESKAETGAGSVEEVVGSWVAEGGVSGENTPLLNAYLKAAGVKTLVDEL